MADKREKIKKFSTDEIAGFCEQVAIILNGGIPLYEGAFILYNEVEDLKTKAVLKQIDDLLRENKPFYQALEATGAFPSYMVYMVRIGELTGKLEDVMRSLAAYYERESSVKTGIKNVVSYPLVMFAMMAVILLILVIRILPLFENVFAELASNAAENTGNMMSFGITAGKVIAGIMAGLFILAGMILLWYKTSKGREIIYRFGCGFFITGKIMEQMAVGKFISAMSLMISSGIDMEEALSMAGSVVEHKSVKEKVDKCHEMVKQEASLDEALKETGLITGMRGRMISVGARTGVMDTVFEKLSSKYDEEIDASLGRLSSIVETVLVAGLSIIVGGILISVMLPLVSIITSIG